ncbi:MAG: NUDIX domain-containing protein [Lachnospiraceae bacterium]|nr:NUDIX domain-containing protein [Lachnospiraceae bacterium]
MEILDIVDEDGMPTGDRIDRETAHREGIRHRTAHVWIMRRKKNSDFHEEEISGAERKICAKYEILLQKRSLDKDSYPGCLDISSAGHIPAGDEVVDSAIREMKEELGITILPKQLHFCGKRKFSFQDIFHGSPFFDRQVSSVYIVWMDIEKDAMNLQKEEIEDVVWMDFNECIKMVKENSVKHCIAMEELQMLQTYILNHKDI